MNAAASEGAPRGVMITNHILHAGNLPAVPRRGPEAGNPLKRELIFEYASKICLLFSCRKNV
jgi:hypothetical protein